jgi:hypothetical protein
MAPLAAICRPAPSKLCYFAALLLWLSHEVNGLNKLGKRPALFLSALAGEYYTEAKTGGWTWSRHN